MSKAADKLKADIKSGKVKVLEAGISSPGKAAVQAVGKAVEKAVESFSKSGKDLTKAENRAVAQQNKAASTYKTTDLAASERAKKAAETRKYRQEEREEYAHSVGEKKGLVKGVAAGAAAGAAAQYVVSKGTQKDHYVTGRKDSTKRAK